MPTPRRSRAVAVLLVLAALAVASAGCGVDPDKVAEGSSTTGPGGSTAPTTGPPTTTGGGGGGDTERFCAILRDLEATAGGNQDLKGALSKLEDLRASAPPAAKADIATLLGAYRSVADLDPSDPETFGKVFAAFLTPEVQAAAKGLTTTAKDECGLTISLGGDDPGTTSTTTPGGSTTTEPEDPDDLTIDQLKAAIDPTYGQAPWRTAINGWSITTFNGTGSVDISGTYPAGPKGLAQALTACKVVSGVVYRRPARAAWSVTVSDAAGARLVARKGRAGTCAKA